jgi:DsbC/DsbD-like thiol-disulfide interchange protein
VKLDRTSPVTVSLRTDKTTVRAGETFNVTVDVQVADGWHIYAMDRPTGVAMPTKLELELPAGVESAGDWTLPDPSLDNSSGGEPAFVYEGTAAFRKSLRVKPGAAAGPSSLRCDFRYQACDRFSCRTPTTLKLEASIQITP